MLFRQIIVLLLIFLILGCNVQPQKNTHHQYDAYVDVNATTDKSQSRFSSLQAALQAAPRNAQKPFRIFIAAGNYYEKLTITKPNIYLIGQNQKSTRIIYNTHAGKIKNNNSLWGIEGSATVTLQAKNIRMENLTIQNSFDFLKNDSYHKNDSHHKNATSPVTRTQAVALFLDKGSDQILIRNSRLFGYQNTLFVNDGHSWFDKVFIAGNVDFIFGQGNAVFTDAEIKTLKRGKLNFPQGYLVAPSTPINDQYGFTFINCRLTRDSSVPDNSVPLGHPWHPVKQFADGQYADPAAIGKTVFINSWMDAHIFIDGWYVSNGETKEGSIISFLAEDARFFEYKSKGPGAQINYKRRQLTDAEAKQYSLAKILGNWNPE